MDEFERELKEAFAAKVESLPATGELPRSSLSRIAARRAVLVVGAMGIAMLLLAATTVAIAQLGHSDVRPAPPSGSREQLQCSEQDSTGPDAPFSLDWTTSTYVIAGGEFENRPWIFCAALAEITHRDQRESEPSLCTEWKYGSGPFAGWTCTNALAHADAAHYFERSGGPIDGPVGSYWGAVSRQVTSVEMHAKGDGVIEAPIYEPPPQLGLDFNFFVGFLSEPNEDVIVKVLNNDGDVLGQEHFCASSNCDGREGRTR
jgi:hypothetical protein